MKNNEEGDARDMTHNYLLPDSWSMQERDKMLIQRNLTVHNLKYDLTKMGSINMILCEIGRVSPVSVSVVVDEFKKESDSFRGDWANETSSSQWLSIQTTFTIVVK